MGAFEHVLVLVSFVYAVALTHLLSSVAAILRHWERVRFSWIHAAWLLNGFIMIVANWLSFWDMRSIASFSVGSILLIFALAFVNYLQAALVCPEISDEGPIDLVAFHDAQGLRYVGAFLGSAVMALIANFLFGEAFNVQAWAAENVAVLPMTAIAALATIFVRARWVQALAVVLLLALWGYYLGSLQGALR